MNYISEGFPVWQTAMDAMDYCWQRRRLVVRFGGVPFVIGLAASWALLFFDVSMTEPSVELFSIALLQALIFLAPTVTWYRIVAYGEQEAGSRPIFTLGRLEIRLFLWQILFMLALLIPFGFAGALIGAAGSIAKGRLGDVAALGVIIPLGIVWLLGFVYVGTRFIMILALASLDEHASFKSAWRLTRGIAWRLAGAFIIIILAIILFVALSELLAWLIGMILAIVMDMTAREILPYARVPAQEAVNLGGLLAIATLFGFAYRMRAQIPAQAAAAPPSSIPVL